jgi:hypothetical protein
MRGRPYWSIDKTHTTRPCTNDRGRNECRSAKSEPIQGAGTAKAGARPPRPAEEKNVAHGPGPIRYRTLAMLDEASFALRMHRPRTHRRRMDGSFWLARPAGELKSPVRRRPGRCRVASGESHQTRAIVFQRQWSGLNRKPQRDPVVASTRVFDRWGIGIILAASSRLFYSWG